MFLITYREHLSIVFTGMFALFTVAIILAGALTSFTTDYSAKIDYFGSVDFRIYHILDIFSCSVNILYLIYMISGVFLTNQYKSDKMGENPKVCIINHNFLLNNHMIRQSQLSESCKSDSEIWSNSIWYRNSD